MLEDDNSHCMLRLEGEMTISSATELKLQLIHALGTRKSLRLNLAAVTELDITTMQLLWLAMNEATTDGNPIALDAPIPAPILASLSHAGLDGLLEKQK